MRLGQSPSLVHRQLRYLGLVERGTVEALERQYLPAAVARVHPRDEHIRVVGEIRRETDGVARFEIVVELPADGPRELLHDRQRREAQVHPRVEKLRELEHEVDVPVDLPGGLRPLHLHDDPLAPGQHRRVHLADGRRSQGLGIEALERSRQREAELLLDDLLHHREGERRHAVLQLDQLVHDVDGHDVGASAEQLPELHERRTQLVEHLADVPAALSRRRWLLLARARQQAEQAVPFEEIAEAVTHRDLGYLPHPLEIADAGDKVRMPGLCSGQPNPLAGLTLSIAI